MTLTPFAPQPAPADVPARFASPFAQGEPAPLLRRAAEELQRRLRQMDLRTLDARGAGKMFGALVYRSASADGTIGALHAFSGMLDGAWNVDGFAPPLFDQAARDAFWPAGERELAVIDDELRALAAGVDGAALDAEVAARAARHARALDEVRARHLANRAARRVRRATEPDTLLDQESRGDTAERRRLDAAQREERAAHDARVAARDAARKILEERRAARSNHFLARILDTYVISNARGERASLKALFAPDAPPGGAGDCAAPKLLGEAYRRGLRPLGLVEFWWGAPPLTGGREHGRFYPACRGKCGAVLPFMLDGLDVEPAPQFGTAKIADDEPRAIFEDDFLVVVDKPCGLLSVPGRHAALRDSVLTRLRRRYPDATGPLVVHRLDLDTSGLLLAAKDAATHTALQKAFARREVDKRYVAWLEGVVAQHSGTIDLALRVDLDDRPRQIHDPLHGDAALTEWRVLLRTATRTKVALFPRTGRTHQLRVHAAHALGLGAPIVGDRLYGREDVRLMLHADALTFTHPRTQERLTLTSPAPF